MSQEVDVLITIRKIIRATDLYSRQLSKKSGLTAPQLLVLQAIQEMGAVAISRLSTHVSLSQATVTSILDRLESRGLVARHRSTMDKRVVHATLTPQGEAMILQAPKPLQDVFSAAFEKLEDRFCLRGLPRLGRRQIRRQFDKDRLDHTFVGTILYRGARIALFASAHL